MAVRRTVKLLLLLCDGQPGSSQSICCQAAEQQASEPCRAQHNLQKKEGLEEEGVSNSHCACCHHVLDQHNRQGHCGAFKCWDVGKTQDRRVVLGQSLLKRIPLLASTLFIIKYFTCIFHRFICDITAPMAECKASVLKATGDPLVSAIIRPADDVLEGLCPDGLIQDQGAGNETVVKIHHLQELLSTLDCGKQWKLHGCFSDGTGIIQLG